MKRFLTFLALAISVVSAATSCSQEDTPDVTGPSIEWASNPDFGTVTVDENLDANLTITAEAGIQSLIVKVESEQLVSLLELAGLSATLDLINDEDVIQILSGISEGKVPCGDQLRNATSVEFNITSLVKLIPNTVEADHVFVVEVSDNDGITATARCVFHTVTDDGENPDDNPDASVTETSISWPGNEDFSPVAISTDMDAVLKVTAVGGIKTFVVTAPESLSTVLTVFGLGTEMDFINDEKLISTLATVAPDMPTGQDLEGKTSVDFDIAPLVNMLGAMLTPGDYEFSLKVSDSTDKEVSADCIFTK